MGIRPGRTQVSPYEVLLFLFVGAICDRPLSRSVQHIFNKNAVTGCGVVDKNVCDNADQFAILDNRRAGHADVK